jgi:superfamily II DNA/RNA helicase
MGHGRKSSPGFSPAVEDACHGRHRDALDVPIVQDGVEATGKRKTRRGADVDVKDMTEERAFVDVSAKKRHKTERDERSLVTTGESVDQAISPEGSEADALRASMQIVVKTGTDIPDLVQSFDEAPFGKKIRAALKDAGFTAPTAIQAQGWPLATRGDDLVSVAKTGSGKTLAFLLPAFRMISKEKLDASLGPVVLVLAPTRELAMQIEEVAVKFGVFAKVTSTTIFGGVAKHPQVKALRQNPHLVVATPGRLMDHMNDGNAKLGSVAMLVLDEADRMLDMGFEPQMDKIMEQVPSERQTLLFSATWPKAVHKLAGKYLKKDFVHVNVGETEELSANTAISQEFFNLSDDEKDNKLLRILYDMEEGSKIIIFANTKHRINNLQKTLWNSGYDCVAMHGDKAQWERDAGLAKFVSGEIPVMAATDVCSRGLDIKDVTHVLNFDMARDVESYIHRIGRTGRAGKAGVSITFFNDSYDIECAPALAKIAREAGQLVPSFIEKAAGKAANTKNKLWRY